MSEFLSASQQQWLNFISDSFIAVSLFYIAVTLFRIMPADRKLRELIATSAFLILAAGVTYTFMAWTVWHQHDRLNGLATAITALIAVITATATVVFAPAVQKSGKVRDALQDHMEGSNHAQLVASEDNLRSCFEAASQAILGVLGDGRIVLVNRRTEEMFGYSREELLGHSLELLLPERFRAPHVAHRKGYFAEPRVRSMGAGMELAGRRKDGSEFPIEIGLSHVNTPDGPLAFGLVSDISESKKAADQLQSVNEELRRSYIEIEQFAHVASHDLQEPLRMITGYLQLIERRYAPLIDDDGREFIAFAVNGAKRMKALIRDLLEFSRAGTNVANLCSVSAASIVQNAIDNLKASIDEHGAQITVDPLPHIVVDSVLLTQVFQNLIANAIKFQRQEIPRVHVSAVRQAGGWIFSVRDTGIGIEAHHLDRIFRIFERLHTTEEYSGSGIGLAVAKKIVERHGGKIWVESQPGIGSTFYFSLSAEARTASAANSGHSS